MVLMLLSTSLVVGQDSLKLTPHEPTTGSCEKGKDGLCKKEENARAEVVEEEEYVEGDDVRRRTLPQTPMEIPSNPISDDCIGDCGPDSFAQAPISGVNELNVRRLCQTGFIASNICESVPPEDRIDCSVREDSLDIWGARLAWGPGGCLEGIFKAPWELLKFVWGVLKWVGSKVIAPVNSGKEAAEALNSVKLYLATEYDKAYDQARPPGRALKAAKSLSGALIKTLFSKIGSYLGRTYKEFGCFNVRAKAKKICGFATEFLIPPGAAAVAFFTRGAVKAARVASRGKKFNTNRGPKSGKKVADIGKMTPSSQIRALDPEELSSLFKSKRRAFSPTQLRAFTGAQIRALDVGLIPRYILDEFTPTQWRNFTPAQIRSITNSHSLPSEVVRNFTPQQVKGLGTGFFYRDASSAAGAHRMGLTAAQRQHLTTEQLLVIRRNFEPRGTYYDDLPRIPGPVLREIREIEKLTLDEFKALSPEQIASFSKHQVSSLKHDMKHLSPEQIKAFRPEHFAGSLRNNFLLGPSSASVESYAKQLGPSQLNALPLDEMSIKFIEAIPPARIPNLKPSKFSGGNPSHYYTSFTPAQVRAMTREQVEAMGASVRHLNPQSKRALFETWRETNLFRTMESSGALSATHMLAFSGAGLAAGRGATRGVRSSSRTTSSATQNTGPPAQKNAQKRTRNQSLGNKSARELSPAQLSPNQIEAIGFHNFSWEEMSSFTPRQLREVNLEAFRQLSNNRHYAPLHIIHLNRRQVAALSPEKIDAIGIGLFSPGQVREFTPFQLSKVRPKEFGKLGANHLMVLSKDQVQSLSIKQLRALDRQQAHWLRSKMTKEQLRALGLSGD